MAFGARPRVLAVAALAAAASGACHRSPAPSAQPDAGPVSRNYGPLVCVEQPDGCVFCAGRDEQAAFLEPDQSRPWVCNPKDEESCVEFCSTATPECALPWSQTKGCVVASDRDFWRALFNLRAADRPEAVVSGR